MDGCFFRNVSYFQTWFGYFTYIKRNGPNIFWVSKNVLDFQMFYPVLNISTCWNEREVVINLSKPRRSVRLDRGGRSLDQQKLKRSSHSSIQNVHGLIEVLLVARGFSSDSVSDPTDAPRSPRCIRSTPNPRKWMKMVACWMGGGDSPLEDGVELRAAFPLNPCLPASLPLSDSTNRTTWNCQRCDTTM